MHNVTPYIHYCNIIASPPSKPSEFTLSIQPSSWPTSGSRWYLDPLYSFIFCGMSYSWTHRVCSLFRLAFFTWQCAFKMPSCLFMAWKFVSFHHWVILHGTDEPQFVTLPIERHLGSFQVLAVTKLYRHSCVGFCVGYEFSTQFR